MPEEENPFANIKNIKPSESVKVGDRFKIAIVGAQKSGKSWMAATAPGPIMYYDFDDRSESLAGKSNIMIKTMYDADPSKPSAILDLESDLATFKYAKAQGKVLPKTFVLDSMSYLRLALDNQLKKAESRLFDSVKIANKPILIPKNYDYFSSCRLYIENIIGEFAALGNLILVFHSKDEKDKMNSNKQETKYTGRLTVEPQFLAPVLSTINHVFFIRISSKNEYIVTAQPTEDIPAATTMKLPKETVPNIQQMLEMHEKALQNQTK